MKTAFAFIVLLGWLVIGTILMFSHQTTNALICLAASSVIGIVLGDAKS